MAGVPQASLDVAGQGARRRVCDEPTRVGSNTVAATGSSRRVPVHARTLRDDGYEVYEAVNAELHAGAFGGEWTPDCCGVCGKPPSTDRHMDRDHDHLTGRPRGLVCGGNQGCNVLMVKWVTYETAHGIALAKVEAGEPDALRWIQIRNYLSRVEAYYSRVEGAVA